MTATVLAEQLAAARGKASALDAQLWRDAITSVAGAYKVQSELVRLAGSDVRAWKVTALSPAQQRGYRSEKPVAGAILAPFVQEAPAELALSQFVTPLLECEISFLLGRDLPARELPYHRVDIEAAIEAIVPALEIADCRWSIDAPDLLKLADDMGNGAFVTGKPTPNWRAIDLAGIDIALAHDGTDIEHGNAAKILGDPLLAVKELADAQPLPAGGLKRGQIVTTGTCTTPIALQRGRYDADFGPLGTVSLTIR
jgi:2-keto-4-pentenoate hydratase